MILGTTDLTTPQEGSPNYVAWHEPRSRVLEYYMTKAILDFPASDLRHIRARGAVMINVADVVHESINSSTVRIAIEEPDCINNKQQYCREYLLGFDYLLNDWLHSLDQIVDPCADLIEAKRWENEFDLLPEANIRAAAILYVLKHDIVGIVRNEMRDRDFPLVSCS